MYFQYIVLKFAQTRDRAMRSKQVAYWDARFFLIKCVLAFFPCKNNFPDRR